MIINYSIIIPHKNTPDLLRRCIDSIPEREDVEIIVVDDGSDDDKFPILHRQDVIIESINRDESKGAGKARNHGLARALGTWVLFADSDDYYQDGLIRFLDKYKDCEADVIYFDHQIVRDEIVIKNRYPYVARYNENKVDSVEEVKYRFNVPWNKMIKRTFLLDYNISFEETPVGNDIFFNYQIGTFAKKIIIDKAIIYNYAVNDNSTIRRKNNDESFYLALIRHQYQCNEFLKYVGHPKWIRSVFLIFVSLAVKKGWRQCVMALKVFAGHYKEIVDSKDLFVIAVKSRLND